MWRQLLPCKSIGVQRHYKIRCLFQFAPQFIFNHWNFADENGIYRPDKKTNMLDSIDVILVKSCRSHSISLSLALHLFPLALSMRIRNLEFEIWHWDLSCRFMYFSIQKTTYRELNSTIVPSHTVRTKLSLPLLLPMLSVTKLVHISGKIHFDSDQLIRFYVTKCFYDLFFCLIAHFRFPQFGVNRIDIA